MKPGTILKTFADFDNAVMFQLPITVWKGEKIIDYGGVIENHTDDFAQIAGIEYLKSACEFRVR